MRLFLLIFFTAWATMAQEFLRPTLVTKSQLPEDVKIINEKYIVYGLSEGKKIIILAEFSALRAPADISLKKEWLLKLSKNPTEVDKGSFSKQFFWQGIVSKERFDKKILVGQKRGSEGLFEWKLKSGEIKTSVWLIVVIAILLISSFFIGQATLLWYREPELATKIIIFILFSVLVALILLMILMFLAKKTVIMLVILMLVMLSVRILKSLEDENGRKAFQRKDILEAITMLAIINILLAIIFISFLTSSFLMGTILFLSGLLLFYIS